MKLSPPWQIPWGSASPWSLDLYDTEICPWHICLLLLYIGHLLSLLHCHIISTLPYQQVKTHFYIKMYSICLAFNPTSTLYHHPSIQCLSCPLTHWLLCDIFSCIFFPLFVWLPFSASDHFAISVASADFYATALYMMDCTLFTLLQKIDLMVVHATLKLRSLIVTNHTGLCHTSHLSRFRDTF